MTHTSLRSPDRPSTAPPRAGDDVRRTLGRTLAAASIVAALSGCYDEGDYPHYQQDCCDSECGYRVSYRPITWTDKKVNLFSTYRTYSYGDCPAGTRPSSDYFCGSYWSLYGTASPQCTIDAYFGATDGDGATIQAVEVGSTDKTVTARITVSIPGTGVWTTPASLSIVGPQHADALVGRFVRPEHPDLIAYPGGVAMTYVTEREVKKGGTIRFGLLRLDDAPVSYKVGTTQQQSVSLNRPRVSTVLGSAQ